MTSIKNTSITALSNKRPYKRPLISAIVLMLTVWMPACKDSEPKAQGSEATAIAHKHADGESCFIEDPSKREAGRLWCKEHARYEDRCWDCHPELRDPKRYYCSEHGLYEDECFLCDPARAKVDPATQPASEEPTP